MSPRLEQLCSFRPGVYPGLEGEVFLPAAGTSHNTNDNTESAKRSHELAEKYPDEFREVSDAEGEVCEGYDQPTLQIKKTQQVNKAPGGASS